MGGGSLASFLIVIWLRRRSEVAMGALGLLCVVVSVRNCTLLHRSRPHPARHPQRLVLLHRPNHRHRVAVLVRHAIADKRHALLTRLLWGRANWLPAGCGPGCTTRLSG